MKYDHEIIRDLMPLCIDGIASEKSNAAVQEHIAECAACRAALEAMGAKTPDVQFRMDTAKEFVKYEKKKKRKLAAFIAGVTAAGVALYFFVHFLLVLGVVGLVLLDGALARVKVDTDPSHYSMYMGENAEQEYRTKWGMDESIFPDVLTDGMEVLDYKMVYYNPWDSQFLSYLTVTYSPDDYAAELDRLEDCGDAPYLGIYGVTGFAGEDDPIAIYSDDYNGFVYAIHTPDKENTITYVELIFCNYFYDLKYEKYIPHEYLPLGFDAHPNNPYKKKMEKN